MEPNAVEKPKIGLLDQYLGLNLGDTAIFESVLRNIRHRAPGAQFVGITLRPRATSRIHGIGGFTATGLSVPFYSDGLYYKPPKNGASDIPESAESDSPTRTGSLREVVKVMPLVGPVSRKFVKFLRALWAARREPPQLWRAYRLAKGLDALIVSGGGQIDDEWGGPWGHPYTLFRWAIVCALARTPYLVLSVGVCRLDSWLSRVFVRLALARSQYRSYRDPGSKEKLSSWRFTKDDPCVPDLAFGLWRDQPAQSQKRADKGRIGVSPIAFGRPGVWSIPDAAVYGSYLEVLSSFVSELVKAGWEVHVFTSADEDKWAQQDLMEKLDPNVQACLKTVPFASLQELLESLSKLDLVVASRLHGAVLAHLSGVPVVAVSFDRKVDAHMEMMNQKPYVLDIRTVSVDALKAKFELAVDKQDDLKGTIQEGMASKNIQVQDQFDQIVDRIVPGKRARDGRGLPNARNFAGPDK